MDINYYSKYINFLKEHNLYDDLFLKKIWNCAIFIDIRDEDYSYLLGGTAVIVDKKNRIKDMIPYMPFLDNDKSVAIAIYTYVQALTQITMIGKKETYNTYFNYILPMFYEKLYISENSNNELLNYESKMRKSLLNNNFDFYNNVLNGVDSLLISYKKKKLNEKQIATKAKRLARNSKYIKNNS